MAPYVNVKSSAFCNRFPTHASPDQILPSLGHFLPGQEFTTLSGDRS
jgi:hypothetical protein